MINKILPTLKSQKYRYSCSPSGMYGGIACVNSYTALFIGVQEPVEIGTTTLFIDGKTADASGDIPLFIKVDTTGNVNKNIPLFIRATVVSSSLPLFISGPFSVNHDIPLVIRGRGFHSGDDGEDGTATIIDSLGNPIIVSSDGYTPVQSNTFLFIRSIESEVMTLFISGPGGAPNNNTTLYISGSGASNNRVLFIKGSGITEFTNTMRLYTRGF